MKENWTRLLMLWGEYHAVLSDMLASDRATVLKLANDSLANLDERAFAMAVAESFTPDELKFLFKNLVLLASCAHAHTKTARALVLRVPRAFVLENIDQVVDPILSGDAPDEFRRVMELEWELDRSLLHRTCELALNHPNSEIQEAGRDFLEKLGENTR